MTLYITEFAGIASSTQDSSQAAAQTLVEQPTLSPTGTSSQSAAFSANTKIIRVHTDAICSISLGTGSDPSGNTPGTYQNPTATTHSPRLAANQTEYFGVSPGCKLAVITNT